MVQNHAPVQWDVWVDDSSTVRANPALLEQGDMKKCQEKENKAKAGRPSELFASFKVKQRSACEDEP